MHLVLWTKAYPVVLGRQYMQCLLLLQSQAEQLAFSDAELL